MNGRITSMSFIYLLVILTLCNFSLSAIYLMHYFLLQVVLIGLHLTFPVKIVSTSELKQKQLCKEELSRYCQNETHLRKIPEPYRNVKINSNIPTMKYIIYLISWIITLSFIYILLIFKDSKTQYSKAK
jgi:hypothetical protein